MKRFLKRHWSSAAFFFIGLILWYLLSATVGEAYATAVGPDFLIKLPVAGVKLAIILVLYRWVMRDRFPSVYAFTKTEGKTESDFAASWKAPLQRGHDPRLALSIHTHLGVLLIVELAVLFAF